MESKNLNSSEQKAKQVFTKDDLVRDLVNLGVQKGDALSLRVSVGSIGWIEGGADTLVEALLEAVGEKGTIVSAAYVHPFPLPLSKENAEKIVKDDRIPSYAGALANAMIKHPDMYRSKHPVNRYVAIGARAYELTKSHTPDKYAYDVLRILAETRGKNLIIGKKVGGTGTDHISHYMLGLKQFRKPEGINYIDEDGQIKLLIVNWQRGCIRGHSKFWPLFEQGGAIIGQEKIGNAGAKLTDMKKTLEIEMNKLRENPSFLLCDIPTCRDCRLSWEFSNGNIWIVNFNRLFGKIKKLFRAKII